MRRKHVYSKLELDKDEKELEANFEKSIPLSSTEKTEMMNKLQEAAQHYFKKDKRITIRIYEKDLVKLKLMAIDEGLPYQTYITSLLHKVTTGRLSERPIK